MIGISSKTVYAVAALYELGSGPSDKLMKIKEIAAETGISQNFLEQILLEMKKNGILLSIKGAHGGYKLAKPLSGILLRDVMAVLENDPFGSPCRTDNPTLSLFWEARREEAEKLFEVPLSELKACEQRVNETLHYTI